MEARAHAGTDEDSRSVTDADDARVIGQVGLTLVVLSSVLSTFDVPPAVVIGVRAVAAVVLAVGFGISVRQRSVRWAVICALGAALLGTWLWLR